MKRVSDWLYEFSSAYTCSIAILLYAGFILFVMVPQAEDMLRLTGDWGAPDGHYFYTPAGLDPLWALVYTLFLVTLLSVALRRVLPPGDPRRLLNLVPLIPMLADLVENLLGIMLVSRYPAQLISLAWLTSAVTTLKWTILGLAHLILILAIIAAGRMLYQTHLSRD